MSFFMDIKIGTRLTLGSGVTLVLLCLTGVLGAYQTFAVNQSTVDIATNWLPSIKALAAINDSAADMRRFSLLHTLAATSSGKSAQENSHNTIKNVELPAKLAAYEKLISSPAERAMYEQMSGSLASYLKSDATLLTLSNAGVESFDKARALAAGESTEKFHQFETGIDKLIELNSGGADDATIASQKNYHRAILITSTLIGLAVLIATGLAVLITRSITIPINAAMEVAKTVAQGDLRSQIVVNGRDETSVLLLALAGMNNQLTAIVSRVRDNSINIASGADQIATGNTDLSQRTEEQAASLEETAASMQQLTATVKQTAENARHGNMLAAAASETACQGGNVVSRVVLTMKNISNSSEKVAQIIAVIESIAFQTNILALNAAVEAARAGEQGRGFAVVAGEVRTLAQRSATAAKEIKDLIGESASHIEAGSKLVEEAGATMDTVVISVKRMTDLMGEIANASSEQQAGIEQVNQAVIQMDEVTQQNAALVEEATAAAQSMAVQASALREIVSIFKLNTDVPSQSVNPVFKPKAALPRPVAYKDKDLLSAFPSLPGHATSTDWKSF